MPGIRLFTLKMLFGPGLVFSSLNGFMRELMAAESTHLQPQARHLSNWQTWLLWPLGALMRLWELTLDVRVPLPDQRIMQTDGEPYVITLWHNRLFVTPLLFRRYRAHRRIYALVSPSKDGAWLSALLAVVGVYTVRGSSSRLGREAVQTLMGELEKGHDVGITPDGPRGPCYEMKPGGLILARRSNAPMMLMGAGFEDAWELASWDRFYIPKPFSRVWVKIRLLRNADDNTGEMLELADVTRVLNEISPDRDKKNTVPPVI